MDVRGTFELHVFCGPLNPDETTVTAFVQACGGRSIKPLHLFLDYEQRGFVGVLQTSRYCTGEVDDAVRECALDAAILREAGFEVLREKVEAVAVNVGVPLTDDEARARGADSYFEYHLLVDSDDEAALRPLASRLAAELGTRVPLSFNALKPSQRFLNTRTYGLGRAVSFALVERLRDATEREGLVVTKVIREFICADTNKSVDNGWLEPPTSDDDHP